MLYVIAATPNDETFLKWRDVMEKQTIHIIAVYFGRMDLNFMCSRKCSAIHGRPQRVKES